MRSRFHYSRGQVRGKEVPFHRCSEKEERLNYRAVAIAEESYRKALADPGPEEQLGD
jgi:hypothetical protein